MNPLYGVGASPADRLMATSGAFRTPWATERETYNDERWILAGAIAGGALSGVALAASTIYALPFWTDEDAVIDRVAISRTTGSGSPNTVVGVYGADCDNGDWMPGSLIWCGWEQSVSSDGVWTWYSVLALRARALYWVALTTSVATLTLQCLGIDNQHALGGIDVAMSTTLTGGVLQAVYTYAAHLPQRFPNSTLGASGNTGFLSNAIAPAIGLRVCA